MNRVTNQIVHLHRKIDRQDNSITPKIDDEILGEIKWILDGNFNFIWFIINITMLYFSLQTG